MTLYSDRNKPLAIVDDDDPEVKVRESELKSLKRKSSLGTYGFLLGVITVILVLAGAYRTEKMLLPQLQKVAAGQTGKVADDLRQLTTQVQQHSVNDAQHALETEAVDKRVDAIETASRRNAASVAAVAARIEPITEQLDAHTNEFVAVRGEVSKLADSQSAIGDSVATHHQAFLDYAVMNNGRVETVLRNVDGLGRRVEIAEEQVAKNSKWTRLIGIGASTFAAITTIHIVGTKGE